MRVVRRLQRQREDVCSEMHMGKIADISCKIDLVGPSNLAALLVQKLESRRIAVSI